MDYGFLDVPLPFDACDRRSCVNITITDDEVLENLELFSVTLRRNGLDPRISLDPTVAEIQITDNDGMSVNDVGGC